jgi:hypothetical protein
MHYPNDIIENTLSNPIHFCITTKVIQGNANVLD